MKKLEIVVKSEKLETLKKILDDNDAKGAMITNIMGYGNQKGYKTTYRGSEYVVNLLPKIKVETIVSDKAATKIINEVTRVLSTDSVGAGKIFVYDVADVIRIRTGENGEAAL